MNEDKFQEGQEAYCVEIGYKDEIKWTVYQVLKVMPKSLKLQEEDYRPRLIRQNNYGLFRNWSGAVIKPSRELALQSTIARVKAEHERYVDGANSCVKHLSLLQDEIDKEKQGEG